MTLFEPTLESVKNYLSDLRDKASHNTAWESGFVCGLANAGFISCEVEDELLKWLEELRKVL